MTSTTTPRPSIHATHLPTLARSARAAIALGNLDPAAAITLALTTASDGADQVRARTGWAAGPMTSERVDQWSELAAVVADVRAGFVSPTLGPVADALARMVDQGTDTTGAPLS